MNQNFTTIIDNKVDGKNDKYIKIRKSDLIEACKVLKERELKVLLFLLSNSDGYTTQHARKMIADNLEMESPNVTAAIKGLVTKGFIEQLNDDDNTEIVRSYAGEKPGDYVAPKKKGRDNRKPKREVITVAEDEFVGDTITKPDYYSGKGEIETDELPF